MPPGSYLAVAHFAKDLYQDQMARFARVLNEPGVVQVSRWRPRNEAESTAAAVWGGVGRKPDRVRIPFARDPAFELNTR